MSIKAKTIIKILGVLIGILLLCYWLMVASLPGNTEINNYRPESTVYNLTHFDWRKQDVAAIRKYVSLRQISPELRTAVIISEDDAFFAHSGINVNELKKAFQENLKKRRYARGASTITMQFARNAFLTKKKTLLRKVREILLARRVEKLWSKQKIFEYYLNIVEWGPNVYGAEAAAWYYFDKPAAQLNLAEAALLTGILPNPKSLNPFKNWAGTKRRQARVLNLMRNARLITEDEYNNLIDQTIDLRGSKPPIVQLERQPQISIFENALRDPRIPDKIKKQADSTGIIFLPEE